MRKLKPIMFAGTASDVGKSLIATGICRILKQDGFRPAPFKAQNMSLNSYATPEGFEIGRAQAVQAEACGLPCHTDMNPVLLKPTNEKSSQVVLLGKPIGTQSAYEYFMGNNKSALFDAAKSAFDRLDQQYSPVVMEGAGSISELNLKHRDITNMRMAAHAGADVYLVADIDKGGVFASVYGTIALLEPAEKALVKGIIINKFRGDALLFEEGKKMLETLCGIPVVGIVPYRKDLYIEEEDSVGLDQKQRKASTGKINIGVVLLERISNFTDFNALEQDPRVHVFYSNDPQEISQADMVILPGSKNTVSDMITLKNNGMAAAVIRAFKDQKTVIGICGGYQMLGEVIEDPLGVEGDIPSISGLGILPVRTVLTQEKTTEQVTFTFKNGGDLCHGYEIHMGQTTATGSHKPLNQLTNGQADGYLLHARCWGTYLHGILDNPSVINDLLQPFTEEETHFDYRSFRDHQYDLLADHLRAHLDMDYIYSHLEQTGI